MIKVLDKTFAIIEMLAVASPRPLSPLVIAEKIKINRTTCSRILKKLMDDGYVIKISRQSGYAAGPRLFTMAQTTKYHNSLPEIAAPIVDRCAMELKQSVLLAILHGGKRYILNHKNCNEKLNIELRELAFDDIFDTATGLILAAFQPESESRKLFEHAVNEPCVPVFPEMQSWDKVCAAFATIRREHSYVRDKFTTHQSIISCPVFNNGHFVAALGCSVPLCEYVGEYRNKVCQKIKETAEELSCNLSTLYTIG